jgi:hypothetical protein
MLVPEQCAPLPGSGHMAGRYWPNCPRRALEHIKYRFWGTEERWCMRLDAIPPPRSKRVHRFARGRGRPGDDRWRFQSGDAVRHDALRQFMMQKLSPPGHLADAIQGGTIFSQHLQPLPGTDKLLRANNRPHRTWGLKRVLSIICRDDRQPCVEDTDELRTGYGGREVRGTVRPLDRPGGPTHPDP